MVTHIDTEGKFETRFYLLFSEVLYHSVQNFLSSGLLSKNLKIKIYKTMFLPVVCMTVKLDLSH
jgi:hypothetical protein